MDDFARMKFRLTHVAFEKRSIVIAWDKTNFLAVFFIVNFQAKLARDLAHFRLGHPSERHQGMRKLFLAKTE